MNEPNESYLAVLLADVRAALSAAGIPTGSCTTRLVRHVMTQEYGGKVQVMVRWGEERDKRLNDQRDREMAASAKAALSAASLRAAGDLTKGWVTVTRAEESE